MTLPIDCAIYYSLVTAVSCALRIEELTTVAWLGRISCDLDISEGQTQLCFSGT